MKVDDLDRLYARSEAATGRSWESIAQELGVEAWRMMGLLGVTRRMSPTEAAMCAMVMDGVDYAQIVKRTGKCYSTVVSLVGHARDAGYDIPYRKRGFGAGKRFNRSPTLSLLASWAMLTARTPYGDVRRVLGWNRNQVCGSAFRLRAAERLSALEEARWSGIIGMGRVCPVAVMAAALPFA